MIRYYIIWFINTAKNRAEPQTVENVELTKVGSAHKQHVMKKDVFGNHKTVKRHGPKTALDIVHQ